MGNKLGLGVKIGQEGVIFYKDNRWLSTRDGKWRQENFDDLVECFGQDGLQTYVVKIKTILHNQMPVERIQEVSRFPLGCGN